MASPKLSLLSKDTTSELLNIVFEISNLLIDFLKLKNHPLYMSLI